MRESTACYWARSAVAPTGLASATRAYLASTSTRLPRLLAGPGVLALTLAFPTSPARGDFIGLKVENVSTAYLSETPDGLGFSLYNAVIFELYAKFDDPNDNLLNVFGAEIQASTNFYHQPNGDGNVSSLPWTKSVYDASGSRTDSFVTLGFSYVSGPGNPDGPDAEGAPDPLKVNLEPSFDESGFLFGSIIDDSQGHPAKGAGWYTPDAGVNNIQGKAGLYPGLNVLIARFAFEAGCPGVTSVGGHCRITYKNGPAVSQSSTVSFYGEASWLCPAPSAAMLLVIFPFMCLRSRRA